MKLVTYDLEIIAMVRITKAFDVLCERRVVIRIVQWIVAKYYGPEFEIVRKSA